MSKYFWAKDIKVTPTPLYYEYQEMFKAHRQVDERIEFLASVIVRKYGMREAVHKYEMYTQTRHDELYKYEDKGFIDIETNTKVAVVTLKREHFNWKYYSISSDYNQTIDCWVTTWVCDELREFIGGVCGV